MADRDQITNELRAVAESVATLLTEHAEHERRVKQLLAGEQLARNSTASTANRQGRRRKLIVADAVLAEAGANLEFETLLYEILARRIINFSDRTFMARGDDKKKGGAGITAPVSAAPPSTAEFAALADRRLRKANASGT